MSHQGPDKSTIPLRCGGSQPILTELCSLVLFGWLFVVVLEFSVLVPHKHGISVLVGQYKYCTCRCSGPWHKGILNIHCFIMALPPTALFGSHGMQCSLLEMRNLKVTEVQWLVLWFLFCMAYLLYVWVFCLYVCVWTACLPGARRGQKVFNPLDMEWLMVVCSFVCSGDLTKSYGRATSELNNWAMSSSPAMFSPSILLFIRDLFYPEDNWLHLEAIC